MFSNVSFLFLVSLSSLNEGIGEDGRSVLDRYTRTVVPGRLRSGGKDRHDPAELEEDSYCLSDWCDFFISY